MLLKLVEGEASVNRTNLGGSWRIEGARKGWWFKDGWNYEWKGGGSVQTARASRATANDGRAWRARRALVGCWGVCWGRPGSWLAPELRAADDADRAIAGGLRGLLGLLKAREGGGQGTTQGASATRTKEKVAGPLAANDGVRPAQLEMYCCQRLHARHSFPISRCCSWAFLRLSSCWSTLFLWAWTLGIPMCSVASLCWISATG